MLGAEIVRMWLFLLLAVVPLGVFGSASVHASPVHANPAQSRSKRGVEDPPDAAYEKAADDDLADKCFDLQNCTNDVAEIFNMTCNNVSDDCVYRNGMEYNALANARKGLSKGSGKSIPGPSGNASVVANHTLEKHFHSSHGGCPLDPRKCNNGFAIAMWFSLMADNPNWACSWPTSGSSLDEENCTLLSIDNNIVVKSIANKADGTIEVEIYFRKTKNKMFKFKISNKLTDVMNAALQVNGSLNCGDDVDTIRNVSWQWNHLVVTACNKFKVSVYWNGNPVHQNQITIMNDHDDDSASDGSGIVFNKGSDAGTVSRAECGRVAFDEFAVFKHCLSHKEVMELRATEFCTSDATTPPEIDLGEVLEEEDLPAATAIAEKKENATFNKAVAETIKANVDNMKALFTDEDSEFAVLVSAESVNNKITETLDTIDDISDVSAMFTSQEVSTEEKQGVVNAITGALSSTLEVIGEADRLSDDDKEEHFDKLVDTLKTLANSMMASPKNGGKLTIEAKTFNGEVQHIDVDEPTIIAGITIPAGTLKDADAVTVITFLWKNIQKKAKLSSKLKNKGSSRSKRSMDSEEECNVTFGGNMVAVETNNRPDDGKVMLANPIKIPMVIQTNGDGTDCQIPNCMYETADDGWSNEGMTITCPKDEDGNLIKDADGQVECVCEADHMTNFAVLMAVTDLHISEAHAQNLSILTIVCTSISLLALFISILILFIFRELHGTRISILKHLSIAMFIAQLVFITAVEKAKVNKKLCLVISVFTHYLYLAVFHWMLAQGIFLYMKLRLAVRSDANIVWFCLIGWGFPAVMVTTTAGINIKAYGPRDDLCWLDTDNGGAWAFVGPVLAIVAINCVVIVMAMKAFTSVKSFKDKDDKEKFKSSLKAMVVMLPLLGLTWFFGVFAHIPGAGGLAFMYIFALCNGLQGFFLFLFHIVFNAEVQKVIRHAILKRSGSVGAGEEPSFFRKMLASDSGVTQQSDYSKTSSM